MIITSRSLRFSCFYQYVHFTLCTVLFINLFPVALTKRIFLMSSGDHFLYSHHLLAEECMDDIGRTYMLSLLGV